MTTATQDKVKPDTFTFQGEVKELDPQTGWTMLAEYREAAAALHAAKERAFAIEQRIMQELAGFEHGAIEGQQLFHWPFVDSTSFDAAGFKGAGPEYKALYDHFCKTKKTRRFRVEGTVGVD
jgi:hypothetical protein